MTLTLEEAIELPFGTLAKQPAHLFAALKQEALQRVLAARHASDVIEAALVFKYNQHARDARVAAGKDSGVVHFLDDGVRVSVDQPKRIEWDQAKLAEIAARITAQGEDPSEFIDVTYKVSESKYNAWSAAMREPFERARTFKPGKPTFRLERLEGTP